MVHIVMWYDALELYELKIWSVWVQLQVYYTRLQTLLKVELTLVDRPMHTINKYGHDKKQPYAASFRSLGIRLINHEKLILQNLSAHCWTGLHV